MADPLEVPLTHGRKVLLDVDGPDWRVAFYRREGSKAKIRELEKRAHTGSESDRAALERLPQTRTTGRDPDLRTALVKAMTYTQRGRYGDEEITPEWHEVETIARYVLEGRHSRAS